MLLNDVYQKLENIKKVSGKNDKRALLKGYMNNAVFARCMTYMFSERMTYNIKELPVPLNVQPMANTVAEIFAFLQKLSDQRGASNSDKEELAALAGQGPTREVVLKIVTGKTDAGFSVTSVNKVVPGFIHKTPYQRCSPSTNLHRVTFPALAQVKADSMFAYCHRGDFISRRGKIISSSEGFDTPDAMTLMGELMVRDKTSREIMSRKKGNGLLNKLAKTGVMEHELIYKVWDIVPDIEYVTNTSSMTMIERWELLHDMVTPAENLVIIPFKVVENEKEAIDYADEMIALGEEGAIIKDYKSIWKNNTAPDLVKLKNFKEAEFIVDCINEGEGKYSGMMGSLSVSSSDNLIRTKVGSGFSDHDRVPGVFQLGDIVTLKYESVITAKKRSEYDSINLPVFIEKRTDKTEADTADYIKNQKKMKEN